MKKAVKRTTWTTEEIKLAKATLKSTKGNQREAAIILYKDFRDTHAFSSIKVKLSNLSKQHPSLKKKYLKNRVEKPKAVPVVHTVKSFVIEGNQLIITF